METWIWRKTADGLARFVLGTEGSNPLITFGINPSTAVPNRLDPTVTRVSRFAARTPGEFDSWVMLNVYPQISTNPKGIHATVDPELKTQNEREIAELVAGRPLTILAAWGTLVESRPYLVQAVRDIVQLPELRNARWVSLGNTTKAGHPRHPLYLKRTEPFVPFDVEAYVSPKPHRMCF